LGWIIWPLGVIGAAIITDIFTGIRKKAWTKFKNWNTRRKEGKLTYYEVQKIRELMVLHHQESEEKRKAEFDKKYPKL
jgi:hypothetical protein